MAAEEEGDVTAPVEVPEGFHVHNESTANWVVRKIVEARQYRERVEAWAAAETRRAEAQERFFMERYGGQLEAWCRQRLEAEGHRRRSTSLPAGTIGFRSTKAGLDVTDEPKLLAWCRRWLPSAVRRTETVLKGAVGDHVEATGELPDGMEVRDAADKFFVK